MKKDRNCNMGPMPIYGNIPAAGNMMPIPGMINYPITGMTNIPVDNTSDITNQINELKNRVTRLENIINNGAYSNNYNSTNYQMM